MQDKIALKGSLRLTGDTDDTVSTTAALSALTTDLEACGVTETTVGLGTAETFKLKTPLLREHVGVEVNVLAGFLFFSVVDHPDWDAVGNWLGDKLDEVLLVLGRDLTSAHEWVEAGFEADSLGEAAADTLDLSQSNAQVVFTVDVGVEHTEQITERFVFDWSVHPKEKGWKYCIAHLDR